MKFSILLFAFVCAGPLWAQQESAPNEPPYTNANEYDSPAVVEAPNADPALPPEKQARTHRASVEYIQHPEAKNGLRLIDSDGSYYYAPKKFSKKEQSSTIRVGSIQPPHIDSPGASFSTMYGSGNPTMLLYDYEWQPLQAFGRLGVQAGFGYFSAQGAGRFADGTAAREHYTFHALPLNLGVIYRLEFMERQWIAPYVAGGASYFALAETRDDDRAPHFVGTPTFYGAGGLMFNISAFDQVTAFTLDSQYGIADMWLTVEARQIQSTNLDLDFTGLMVSVGISADY